MNIEFKKWPSIPRDNPFSVTITEKMDGTNACIVITDGEIIAVQSRARFITPKNDNYGFAGWVERNNEELLKLGNGYHYGEWTGPGIQKNPHCLPEKKLFLFNTHRWSDPVARPSCVEVVPILYQGDINKGTIPGILEALILLAEGTSVTPEGVVVFYHAFRTYTKHTIKSPNGKWCK